MKRSNWRIALLLLGLVALLWLLFAPRFRTGPSSAPPPSATRPVTGPAGQEELKKFQGSWDFVALEVEGEQKPEADFRKYTVEFKDDQWIVSEGGQVAAQSTIVLDPTSKPKTIDVFPPAGKGLPIHGIYLLEGDKLTICDRDVEKGDRPADFVTEPDSGLVLIVFQRPRP